MDTNEIRQVVGLRGRSNKKHIEYDHTLQQQQEAVREAARLLRQQRQAEKESGIRLTPKFKGLPR